MTEWRALTSAQRIALVQANWTIHMSASKVAAAIGLGVTRNAVVGIYHRFPGLKVTHPLGGNNNGTRGRPRGEAMRKPRMTVIVHNQELVPQTTKSAPISRYLALTDLQSGECKWPHGTGPYTFCGAPTDRVYCAYHARLAVDNSRVRR